MNATIMWIPILRELIDIPIMKFPHARKSLVQEIVEVVDRDKERERDVIVIEEHEAERNAEDVQDREEQ